MSLNENGTLYTAKEVADLLGIKPGSVAKFARRHGVGRLHSGVYWFNQNDINKLKVRSRNYGKMGKRSKR